MAGKVRIQGDMTKLMMAQAGGQGGNPALIGGPAVDYGLTPRRRPPRVSRRARLRATA